jgi:CTP-dependent riboflavin kinase
MLKMVILLLSFLTVNVRVHPKNIIEIIAPQNIKASLNVKDGDSVTVVFIR